MQIPFHLYCEVIPNILNPGFGKEYLRKMLESESAGTVVR